MRSMKVNLDKKLSSSYEICIGNSIGDRMALLLSKNHKANRILLSPTAMSVLCMVKSSLPV